MAEENRRANNAAKTRGVISTGPTRVDLGEVCPKPPHCEAKCRLNHATDVEPRDEMRAEITFLASVSSLDDHDCQIEALKESEV